MKDVKCPKCKKLVKFYQMAHGVCYICAEKKRMEAAK